MKANYMNQTSFTFFFPSILAIENLLKSLLLKISFWQYIASKKKVEMDSI
jgi:hypothetical protein